MKRIVKVIPNTLTMGSLITGCIGLLFLIQGNITASIYMIWLAALLDFLDGFAARGLKAYSEMGKQLDSLADMISFGVLPALILFMLISKNTEIVFLPFISLSISVFSAIRLARFNLDESQDVNFKGMPTPAGALLISGIAVWSQLGNRWMIEIGNNPYFLSVTAILLSWLMVSRIEFPSLKITNFNLKSNILKIIMVSVGVLLIIFHGLSAIAIIFYLYIILALVQRAFKL